MSNLKLLKTKKYFKIINTNNLNKKYNKHTTKLGFINKLLFYIIKYFNILIILKKGSNSSKGLRRLLLKIINN